MKHACAVDAFHKVIHDFEEAMAERSKTWPALFDEFDVAFKDARKDRAEETPRLNILDVFGLKTWELCHSRVVAWFLKEDESHEQGGLFIDCLLSLCGVPGVACTDYTVQRETEGKIDIVAYKPRAFAVFIENKVRHHEEDKQVARLQVSLVKLSIYREIPEARRIAVFLTDDGRPPTTAHEEPLPGFLAHNLRPLSRLTLFRSFREGLAARTVKSSRLTNFLTDYLDAISTHHGSN